MVLAYTAEEQYKSQDGQDKWANEKVFKGKTRGVFLDLGCYDGVTYSNTWYFERVLNWTGVCVEPNPEVYPRISSQAGRATGVQVAVSDRTGTAPFVAAYMRSSLNASAVDYAFLQSQGVVSNEVRVALITPSLLLERHLPRGATTVDYVNIDVEQQELAILRVWPFHRYCVRVFNIENEPPKGEASYLPAMVALLKPHGYTHQLRIGVDEVFVRSTPCPGASSADGGFGGASSFVGPGPRRGAGGEGSGGRGGRRRALQQRAKRQLAMGKDGAERVAATTRQSSRHSDAAGV